MKRKLTLRMDEDAIEFAKEYASQRNTSVSKLVEQFFEALQPAQESSEIEYSQMVEALAGIAEGADISIEDYYEHLDEKHR